MQASESLNDGERTALLQTIKTRIKYIIQSVETLLNNNGILQIAGALYIHAVEEYGKYLYVKNLPSENGVVVVKKDKFTNHPYKINLAKDDLPTDCFVLKQGTYGAAVYGRASYDVHEVPDWQTRLTIFNTDLEDGKVPALPDVDPTDLRRAVNEFKSHLNL